MTKPVAFIIRNEGNGAFLYNFQESIWQNCPIFVGVDLTSGHIHVEGSCRLYDELYAFQGIDEYDFDNCVRVADYIACIKAYDTEYYNSLL